MDYVFDEKYSWIGWYRLQNGMLLHCEEYEGSGLWDDDWVGCDPIPDGAVNYTIYDGEGCEYDGGIVGYMFGESFANFEEFLGEMFPRLQIVEKVDEPEWGDE
jgi:hypothetical protein